MKSQETRDIYVVVITPCTNNQLAIEIPTLDEHINRLVDAGVQGLVPGGKTGEFTALNTDECKQLVAAVVRSARGRVGVMAGSGDLFTAKTVELAVHAADAGANSVMVVPPFYDAPTLEEMRKHLSEIHKASGRPLIYCNTPSATGSTLTSTELALLSEVGVYYLKNTSGNAPALTDMILTTELRPR